MGTILDFQKAVEAVDYYSLLDKLYCYGMHGIVHEWLVRFYPVVNSPRCIIDKNLNPKWTDIVLHMVSYFDLCSFSCISVTEQMCQAFYTNTSADDTNLFCTETEVEEMIDKWMKKWLKFMPGLNICKYKYRFICVYIHMRIYTYAYIYKYIYIYMHTISKFHSNSDIHIKLLWAIAPQWKA